VTNTNIANIPKSVLICGVPYAVNVDPDVSGGYFTNDDKITVEKTGTQFDQREIFLHEVLEAILVVRGVRYCRYSTNENSGYRFVMNHDDFEMVVRDLAAALGDFINGKLKRRQKKRCKGKK